MTDLRPMTDEDVDAVMAVIDDANTAADHRAGQPRRQPSAERRAFHRAGMHRFVARDPDGAWVAIDDEGQRVVGMVEAIRRDDFWGLSMLFVSPSVQSRGIGRRLLDAALASADGANVRMIMTSADPRALRRYALADLTIHPAVEATGAIDRSAIPSGLPGRPGGVDDLGLVAQVDATLRGSRAEDVAFMLDHGFRMEVIEQRGYVLFSGHRLAMLGAVDQPTAALLLWRFLAEAGDEAEIWCLTAQQDWAVQVALSARLRVVPAGPLFVGGRSLPPGPWLPSGWYF